MNLRFLTRLAAALTLLFGIEDCTVRDSSRSPRPAPEEIRKAAAAMNEHTQSLMSIPGVVGVYVGATPDSTPCIRVLVERKDAAPMSHIPARLGDYPVEIEETGTVAPLDK